MWVTCTVVDGRLVRHVIGSMTGLYHRQPQAKVTMLERTCKTLSALRMSPFDSLSNAALPSGVRLTLLVCSAGSVHICAARLTFPDPLHNSAFALLRKFQEAQICCIDCQ